MIRFMGRTLIQALAIALLGAVLALAVNHFRGECLPLVGDWSAGARFRDDSGQDMTVALDRARELHQQGALFLDARSSEVFKQGHIAGARNLPWESFDKRFDEILSDITPERDIITYCDGESCNLSHELAITLKAMGFSKVKVLVNGWTVWQEAGLPIESGPDGGKG